MYGLARGRMSPQDIIENRWWFCAVFVERAVMCEDI